MRSRFGSMVLFSLGSLLFLIVIAVSFDFIPLGRSSSGYLESAKALPIEAEELPPPGSRLLIVAPHCDDEILGSGILLHRALKGGRQVKVILVTNGDGFTLAVDRRFLTLYPSSREYRLFGQQRQVESLKALEELGLTEKDVVFLGYPDGGIAHLWTENWDRDKPYFDKFTQTDISPYNNSFNKNASYTGANLLSDLEKIIADYHPTDIYYPHPNDRHNDHWSVNAFIKYLLEEKQLKNVREHLYLVHRGTWPTPRLPRPDQNLYPPVNLTGSGTQWRQFSFLPGEADLKRSAILKYTTQIRVIKNFLLSFVRSSEIFGYYPDYLIPRFNQSEPETEETIPAIQDPAGDFITNDLQKAGDITKVASYITEDRWVIEAAASSPVNKNIIYRVHGRFFPDAGTVRRFDLVYCRGQVSLKKYACNSVATIPGLRVEEIGGRLRITLPLENIRGIRAVFLNADNSRGPFNIDRTAWRLLRF